MSLCLRKYQREARKECTYYLRGSDCSDAVERGMGTEENVNVRYEESPELSDERNWKPFNVCCNGSRPGDCAVP